MFPVKFEQLLGVGAFRGCILGWCIQGGEYWVLVHSGGVYWGGAFRGCISGDGAVCIRFYKLSFNRLGKL